jgi:hypothetical protein
MNRFQHIATGFTIHRKKPKKPFCSKIKVKSLHEDLWGSGGIAPPLFIVALDEGQ